MHAYIPANKPPSVHSVQSYTAGYNAQQRQPYPQTFIQQQQKPSSLAYDHINRQAPSVARSHISNQSTFYEQNTPYGNENRLITKQEIHIQIPPINIQTNKISYWST
eukprot:UN04842